METVHEVLYCIFYSKRNANFQGTRNTNFRAKNRILNIVNNFLLQMSVHCVFIRYSAAILNFSELFEWFFPKCLVQSTGKHKRDIPNVTFNLSLRFYHLSQVFTYKLYCQNLVCFAKLSRILRLKGEPETGRVNGSAVIYIEWISLREKFSESFIYY